MKQLVEFLTTSLVDDASAVRVDETRNDKKFHYAVSVKQEDLGKVIGKKGRTVKAMRVLLSALASMQNRQVTLEVLEPELPPSEQSEEPSEVSPESETAIH